MNEKPTFYKSIIRRIENNKFAAVLLIIGIIVLTLGHFLDVIDKGEQLIDKWFPIQKIEENIADPNIPIDSSTPVKTYICTLQTTHEMRGGGVFVDGDSYTSIPGYSKKIPISLEEGEHVIVMRKGDDSCYARVNIQAETLLSPCPPNIYTCTLVTIPEVRGGAVFVDGDSITSISWGSLLVHIDVEEGDHVIVMRNGDVSCHKPVNIQADTRLNPCY